MDHEVPSRSLAASQIQVSDLDLASYLVGAGARLVGVAATVDPARKSFLLEGDPEFMAKAMNWFHAGDALVEPRNYSYARRFLRRALELH